MLSNSTCTAYGEGAKKAAAGDDRRPNKWANGGSWMGRRNDILAYYQELETYLVENVKSQGEGDGFKKACMPYKMSAAEVRAAQMCCFTTISFCYQM